MAGADLAAFHKAPRALRESLKTRSILTVTRAARFALRLTSDSPFPRVQPLFGLPTVLGDNPGDSVIPMPRWAGSEDYWIWWD
jgi:hypothetical protein